MLEDLEFDGAGNVIVASMRTLPTVAMRPRSVVLHNVRPCLRLQLEDARAAIDVGLCKPATIEKMRALG